MKTNGCNDSKLIVLPYDQKIIKLIHKKYKDCENPYHSKPQYHQEFEKALVDHKEFLLNWVYAAMRNLQILVGQKRIFPLWLDNKSHENKLQDLFPIIVALDMKIIMIGMCIM